MRIFVKEITEQEREYHFTSKEHGWVRDTLSKSDETPPLANPPRPETQFDFTTQKIDEILVTGGQIKAAVNMICSRCATHFYLPIKTKFQALFSKDPTTAGAVHERNTPSGRSRHAANDEETYKTDIALLTQDFIDLSEVLSEQLELEKPTQPLCTDSCKGICQYCGADLNKGRCACNKIHKESPFQVLKGFSPKVDPVENPRQRDLKPQKNTKNTRS